jgi:hypothetical protein
MSNETVTGMTLQAIRRNEIIEQCAKHRSCHDHPTRRCLPAETDSIGRQLREPLAPEDDMSDLRKLEMALAQRDALVEALEAILETDPQGYDVAPMSYVLRKQAKAALRAIVGTGSKP